MAPTSGDCVHCGKPDATSACKHLERDGSHTKTFFCDKHCQRAHWPKHKSACVKSQERVKLYQAGEFFADITTAYNEHACNLIIGKVEVGERGKLHVHEGKYLHRHFQGYDRARFPHLTEHQHQQLLNYGAWQHLRFCLVHFGKILVQALGKVQIRRYLLAIKPERVQVLVHEAKIRDAEGNPTSHYEAGPPEHIPIVLSAEFSDGIKYVIDPYGAGHYPDGQYVLLRPFEDYEAEVVHRLASSIRLEQAEGFDDDVSAIMLSSDPSTRAASTFLNRLMPEGPSADLIKLPSAKFQQKRAKALEDFRFGAKLVYDVVSQHSVLKANPLEYSPLELYSDRVHRGKYFCFEAEPDDEEDADFRNDPVLVQLAEKATETNADDDLAEVGHRMVKLDRLLATVSLDQKREMGSDAETDDMVKLTAKLAKQRMR